MKPSFIRHAFAVALATFAAHGAFAQEPSTYPSQPLRIVVPYPAGGATDTLARIVATKLQESWHQTVIVENKPGASGTMGNDMVAKAPRDGHTILLGITALVQVQSLMPKLPYDGLKDLQPLVQVATTNSVFFVPPSERAGPSHRAAMEQFTIRGIARTKHRCGILIFVSLAERYARIIADQGIADRVPQSEWQSAIDVLVAHMRDDRIADGFISAISACGNELATHFPRTQTSHDELPDRIYLI